MKILMVVEKFIPEIGSAAHLFFDLSKAFMQKGHEVHVITSYPRKFNMDTFERNNVFPLEEIVEGIYIHRCYHPVSRDNIVLRGLEHFYIPYYYYRKYREIGKKFDVCLMYIPPLPLYYLANKIKRLDGTPSVLNIQDFHPQELTDVGVLKNPVMIKILEYIERKAYKNADHITVLSHEGIEYVVKKGAHPDNVTHIFNSVYLSDFDFRDQTKNFKVELGIENLFLVSYAGILSPYQGIDNILDVAKTLCDHPDIIFCIAGDGSEKQHLENRVTNEGISNIRFLPTLARNKYFNLVRSSDISFISLDKRMKAPCIPGKTINIMASMQPTVAMVSEDSATAELIRKAQCGIIVNPDDKMGIRSAILHLKENVSECKELGKNGRDYLESNMNLEKTVVEYERIFNTLGDKGHFSKNSSLTVCEEE